MEQHSPKILVTGGGTSGHISPALALIETLRGLSPGAQFLYIGSKNGLERGLVEATGVPFVAISTGKLRRYISPENLLDQFRIPVGLAQSLIQIKRWQPDVVLATGGYVTVPPVVAAGLCKVPILIHEQTVQLGLANRINARFATKIALSWEEAMNALPPQARAKAWVSGNPVRASIFGGTPREALNYFGLSKEELPTIYVTGGSLGARVINRAIEACLPELLERARVIHQCGEQSAERESDFERLTRARLLLPDHLQKRYALAKFIRDELRDVLALADLVIGRAGAGTVTELCAVGKPALYVPLVPTGGDEQTKNAGMAVGAGAARILVQADCDGPHLLEAVSALLADPRALHRMGEAARKLVKPAAARDIARAVLELVGNGEGASEPRA